MFTNMNTYLKLEPIQAEMFIKILHIMIKIIKLKYGITYVPFQGEVVELFTSSACAIPVFLWFLGLSTICATPVASWFLSAI